jgi:hypothetical protein
MNKCFVGDIWEDKSVIQVKGNPASVWLISPCLDENHATSLLDDG